MPVPSVVERHDARAFGAPYSPGFEQANLVAAELRRRAIEERGVIPLEEAARQLDARFLPLQTVNAPFPEFIEAYGVAGAKLVIPMNPRRWAFSIGNFTGANLMILSYGKPIDMGQGIGAGLPIGGCFNEQQTEISIDDIWAFCNDPAETYPIPIVGFEGGISVAGNKR